MKEDRCFHVVVRNSVGHQLYGVANVVTSYTKLPVQLSLVPAALPSGVIHPLRAFKNISFLNRRSWDPRNTAVLLSSGTRTRILNDETIDVSYLMWGKHARVSRCSWLEAGRGRPRAMRPWLLCGRSLGAVVRRGTHPRRFAACRMDGVTSRLTMSGRVRVGARAI
ncbi:hypothetical protein BC628DRAFT_425169 [Trametes gibbosa]|nr:hypothetical protein BC628DRAFT_425169 [Trametes gibbosa]